MYRYPQPPGFSLLLLLLVRFVLLLHRDKAHGVGLSGPGPPVRLSVLHYSPHSHHHSNSRLGPGTGPGPGYFVSSSSLLP